MSKGRILIVDDAAVNRLVAQSMLEKDGFETVVAADGRAAIKVFESQPIDLILMDSRY